MLVWFQGTNRHAADKRFFDGWQDHRMYEILRLLEANEVDGISRTLSVCKASNGALVRSEQARATPERYCAASVPMTFPVL